MILTDAAGNLRRREKEQKTETIVSDTETEVSPDTQAAEEAAPVTEADIASRGVGVKVETLDPEKDAAALAAVQAFKDLQAAYDAADKEAERLKNERNAGVKSLKDEHNISFTSIAEIIGNTSSLVLYLYQRAAGMTSAEIRAASQRSAAAKAQFQTTDPNRKPVRKQSDAEKEIRKRQREELRAFLDSERARKEAAGEDTSEEDAGVSDLDAEDLEG
jgi:hypothetical protein